eukprot:XP_015573551.1 uncharacterized protein LOC107261117 [Ricinus communis]
MNEVIRTKLMKRIHKNGDAMKRMAYAYYPKILKKLEKSKKFCWMFTTEWYGGERFQVVGLGGQFVVDKQEMTCTCRRWDLIGIPCCHGVCAIWYNENPKFHIHDFYKVETYLKCYSHLINPTTSKEFWPKATAPPVLPSKPIKPRKGRPARKRRLEEEEMGLIRNGKVTKKGFVMTCTVCGAKGHNKRFHSAGASTRQQRREKLLVSNEEDKKTTKGKESNAENSAQNVFETHKDDQPDHLFNVTSSAKKAQKPAVQLSIPAHLVDYGDYASQ